MSRAPLLRWLLAVTVLSGPGAVLRAQCPDGTPPPCAGQRAPGPARNSIAVLYFDNLSRDSGDVYLADGLTEEIIVRLQHVQRLDVKSRYEVRRFQGTRIADARSVGRELRVAYLVTGSVRPSPTRMRVSYELVRTSDGRALVSDIVDTTAADPWAISNAVALAIARQVAGRLAPEERAALTRGPTRDAQALDLYRRGVGLVERGIRSGDQSLPLAAVTFFAAAVERDSAFADAWAAMADAYGWSADEWVPNRWAAERARAAARRALALDSASGKAAAWLAFAMMTVDHDWAGAERVLRRSIVADPRATDGYLQLSLLLTATGRPADGWAMVEAAWEGDSLNPRLRYYVWSTLGCAHRFDDLLRWSDRLGEAGPYARFLGYLGTGQTDSALAYAARSPNTVNRVMALAAAGRIAEARDSAAALAARLDSIRARGSDLYVTPEREALAWAAARDPDHAFAALERSFAQRTASTRPYLACDPAFDNLRSDPRYHDLLRRMHLEP